MERKILFRFNRRPNICKNRVALLKKLNPNIEIYGLFDKKVDYNNHFKEKLDPYLEKVYFTEDKEEDWGWINGDIAIRNWYKKIGKNVSFDMLHIIEWDLILLEPINKIYKHIPKEGVGLTALSPLKFIEKDWDWTSRGKYKAQWQQLKEYVKKEFNYNKEPYMSLGPGPCLSRKFLEEYSKIKVPELCNDEVRLPLFSQCLGFKLYNTNLTGKNYDKSKYQFFNCEGQGIKLSIIKDELKKPKGRRVFHPFRKRFDLNLI